MPYKNIEDQKAYDHKRYSTQRERMLLYDSIRHKQRTQELRLKALSYYSQNEICCVKCRIDDIDVLQLDHIDGGGNKHRSKVGRNLNFWRWLEKNSYPSGFQVLCANCNVKKEIERRREVFNIEKRKTELEGLCK